MAYIETYKVIGSGDFVAALSRVDFAGTEMAVIDLFRVSDGKIVEHLGVSHPRWVRYPRMSHSIQIRNVPTDVHRTLRARAAAAGLSLSDYLPADITRVAERPQVADVILRAGSRSGGADIKLIVEAVRLRRDRP